MVHESFFRASVCLSLSYSLVWSSPLHRVERHMRATLHSQQVALCQGWVMYWGLSTNLTLTPLVFMGSGPITSFWYSF